jgi:hypothetical protein
MEYFDKGLLNNERCVMSIYRPDLFSTEKAEDAFLLKHYAIIKKLLPECRRSLRAVLSVEGKYNTFDNDAMENVLQSIEAFMEYAYE